VSYAAPWPSLLGKRFATAIAFEQGTHTVWVPRLILGIALVALLQVFNGNFVASTRLLYAFGRRRTIPGVFGAVHERYQTPKVAIAGVGLATLVGLLLGDALLVPVSEVGSMASAFGWLAACTSFLLVERRLKLRVVAAVGACVSLMLVLMKLLPGVPGHFTIAEWVALATWLALGFALHIGGKPVSA